MSNLYSVGHMNQLADSLEKAGFTSDDVTKLKQYDNLAGIRALLYGHAKLEIIEHIIDLDTKPFIPEGWSVKPEDQIASRVTGTWKFDPKKIMLHLSKNQQNDKCIEGNKLKKELAKMQVLGANALDYLLAHKELIPEDWKKDEKGNIRYIFFWGTIYRDSYGNLYVRFLYFRYGLWLWVYGWLDDDFFGYSPSAVLASN